MNTMNSIATLVLAQAWTAQGLSIAGKVISTKTLAGWALGIVFIVVVVKAIGTISEAKKEHEAGERNEKVKFAIITVLASLALLAILDYVGLISFTEISNGFSSL